MAAVSIRRNLEIDTLVRQFDERLRLARAAELASGNRLVEAESLLCPEGVALASAVELDLLARINVKQYRFADARKRWEQAISRSPEKRAEFEQCLTALDTFSAKWLKRRTIERWAILSIVIFLLMVDAWLIARRFSP
jgi:hypothetical protein